TNRSSVVDARVGRRALRRASPATLENASPPLIGKVLYPLWEEEGEYMSQDPAGGDVQVSLVDFNLLTSHVLRDQVVASSSNGRGNSIACFTDTQGRSAAVVIGPDDTVIHICRDGASRTGWSGWPLPLAEHGLSQA